MNTISKFPLPGQIGVFVESKMNQQETQEEKILREKEEEEYSKQFDLFYRPLPSDHQMHTLMQIGNVINNEEQNSLDEKLKKKLFELKAYKCPKSLAKGEELNVLIYSKKNKFFFSIKDFQNYFPTAENPLTVITVSFKTQNDMSTYSNSVEEERELLMKQVRMKNLISHT